MAMSGPARESKGPDVRKENEPLTRISSTMVATFVSTFLQIFSYMAGSFVFKSADICDFVDSISPDIALQVRPQSRRVHS